MNYKYIWLVVCITSCCPEEKKLMEAYELLEDAKKRCKELKNKDSSFYCHPVKVKLYAQV